MHDPYRNEPSPKRSSFAGLMILAVMLGLFSVLVVRQDFAPRAETRVFLPSDPIEAIDGKTPSNK
jgi:hypothetical protein